MVRSLKVDEMFLEFYEEWMRQLEEGYLALLLLKAQTEKSDDAICVATVNKLTAHHKEFYKVKWAHGDVLGLFSPIWLTPLEKAFLWVTGWKPSMAFQLLDSLKEGLGSMTEDQTRKIESLLAYIKAEEEKVEREIETQRGRVADRNMVTLSQLQSSAEDVSRVKGLVGSSAEDSATLSRVKDLVEVSGLVDGMEGAMKMGDYVRLKTLEGVLEVLNPMQGVEFLTGMCKFEMKMREWGKIYVTYEDEE